MKPLGPLNQIISFWIVSCRLNGQIILTRFLLFKFHYYLFICTVIYGSPATSRLHACSNFTPANYGQPAKSKSYTDTLHKLLTYQNHLHCHQFEPPFLESTDDVADEPSLDSVWLHHDKRSFTCGCHTFGKERKDRQKGCNHVASSIV